jgi:hypothetical protein
VSEQYNTIKEIVFEMIHNTQGHVKYDELESKVLSHFPNSAFKRNHWSWYRNQCSKGRYAGEFSGVEKGNLSSLVPKKNKGPTLTVQKECGELNTIDITKKVLKVVDQVIQSALEYESTTGGTRKLGITGEVGEILACYHLGLRLCVDPRAAGFDAIDCEGKKVQIKTRRSETEGLPRDAGRIGTFSKHSFDYALLVLLDREYHVAEIWRAEYDDVSPLIEKQKRRNPNLSSFKKASKRVWRSY